MTPFCMFGEWKPLTPAPLGKPAYAIRKINMIAGGEFNQLSGQNVMPGGSLARVRWHAPNCARTTRRAAVVAGLPAPVAVAGRHCARSWRAPPS
jgi:hypothetical protein